MANNPFVPQTGTSTSSGGSRWITNPKHLNAVSILQTLLVGKITAINNAKSDTANFFTGQALRGAQTSIAVADTFVTLCDISNASGFAFNFVSPTHTAAFIPTIRITVDGVMYTIAPSASIALANRLVLGPLVNGSSASAVASATIAGDILGPGAPSDIGFKDAAVGGVAVIATAGALMSIPTPGDALSYNMQCLRFESSLKVEMKASLLSATAVDKQCSVTFRLDL